MTFQCAEVNKALGSVNSIVRKGNRVVFDMDSQGRDIAYIQSKEGGKKMRMRVEKGVYVLDVLIGPPNQGFAGQGQT